jgi:hypothetical protein
MTEMMKPRTLVGLILAALCLLLAAPPGRSASKKWDTKRRDYRTVLVDPEADDTTERRVLKITGFSTWVEESSTDPGIIYLHREERTDEGDKVKWKFTVGAEDFRLIRSDRTTTTRAGKPLEQVTEYFENSIPPNPPGTFHFNMMSLVMQAIDFTPGTVKNYQFVFSPTFPPWKATVNVIGEDTVTVPAGTFQCVKLELEYSTDNLPGFMRLLPDYLLKKMMSGYFLWMEKEAPHGMVKFQGKIDGMGSPEKAQELIKVQ